ncbi:MAG: nucleotide pyrophosphohydrolase [Rhodocyclaceae bacterium]|nr:nucleotide pyrophosphohydrolase [Rhodocyclaceae bacterium]
MGSDRISEISEAVLAFRDERDWAQFHTLRKLITSLNLEAAELLEHTQWLDDDEIERLARDPAGRQALGEECADVLLYLLLIAERAGIDLAAATWDKLASNAQRYPVALAHGSREKYTRLRKRAGTTGAD